MAVVMHQPTHGHLARWAWVSVAVTPVVWVLVVVVGLAGEGGAGSVLGTVLVTCAAAAAPVAALVLGIRAHERTGTAAAVVAGLLLVLTLIGLPLLVI